MMNDDLDECLLSWFKQQKDADISLDGPLLLEKANSFSRQMGWNEVARSWIARWKRRHTTIGSQRVVEESASVDTTTVEKWKEEVLMDILKEYLEDNIFNMDETGLFYKLITDI